MKNKIGKQKSEEKPLLIFSAILWIKKKIFCKIRKKVELSMKNIMESSETLAHLPLDFSVTMMNFKLKNELNNNSSNVLSQNNHQTSSAFKVVTPRGKSDGKLK